VSGVVILDGGTGRELARSGAPFRQPEWSALALIEAPHFVAQVHQRYVAAGADVITTNSYAVVPFHIGQDRFDAHGAQWAALAGRLARDVADAAPRKVAVAGSLPPVSALPARPDRPAQPCGAGRSGGSTGAPCRSLAGRNALGHCRGGTGGRPAPTGKPLWLSFTLADEDPAAAPQLRSGESVAEAAAAALRLGARALLFNCSQPEVMAAAVAEAKAALAGTDVAIGVYANAFPPQGADAEANNGLSPIRADLTPEGYAAFARAWAAQGATILGGCCGIGPEHIATLRHELA
jgi:S-methylmethionine-dependent homocysteine/selenocysteine methylase